MKKPDANQRRNHAEKVIIDQTRLKAEALESAFGGISAMAFDYDDLTARGKRKRAQGLRRGLDAVFKLAVSTPPEAVLQEFDPEEREMIVEEGLTLTEPALPLEGEPSHEPSPPLPQFVGQLSLQFESDQ